jgi:hypothetical protein
LAPLLNPVAISARFTVFTFMRAIGVVAQISQSPQGFQQLGSRKNGIFMRIYSLKPLVRKDLIMQQSHFFHCFTFFLIVLKSNVS